MHCPFYDKIYLAERCTLKYENGNFFGKIAIHFHVCLLHSAEIIVWFFLDVQKVKRISSLLEKNQSDCAEH